MANILNSLTGINHFIPGIGPPLPASYSRKTVEGFRAARRGNKDQCPDPLTRQIRRQIDRLNPDDPRRRYFP